MHGTTPRPRDPEEFYVSIAEPMQRKFPRKRTASELQTSGFERPSKLRKDNLSEMECVPVDYSTLSPQVTSNDYVPTINWNSGKSPLDAWLNQSALPSATLSLENEPQEKEFREQEATAREMKEIGSSTTCIYPLPRTRSRIQGISTEIRLSSSGLESTTGIFWIDTPSFQHIWLDVLQRPIIIGLRGYDVNDFKRNGFNRRLIR